MKFLLRKLGIPMNNMMTVIKFTFMNRFRSKSFKISSLIFAIILSIAINLPSIIAAFSSDKPTNVGVLTSASEIPNQMNTFFAQKDKPGVKIVAIPDAGSPEANEKTAKAMMEKKEIKGYLQITEGKEAGFPKVTYKSEGTMEFDIKSKLQEALQKINTDRVVKDSGLSQQQLTQLSTPIEIDTEQITLKASGTNKGKTQEQIWVAYALIYFLLILLFITVQLYGNLIATEVTAEKSSRVMELLITSISPLKQMFGKVIGMFLLGLTQLAFLAVVVAINIQLPNNSGFLAKNNIKLSEIPLSLFVYFILFFILGFFLFAMLYAAVGSLISRTEDLAQSVLPVTFLMLGSFYIGIFGLNNPTASFVTAMSFVPFFTPLIMFLRIGMTDPAGWEIGVSIAGLLLTIVLVGWVSAKMYRVGVLMYGKKPSFKEVFKAMRAYRA
jgi:ABC-2 type transport system permease protein